MNDIYLDYAATTYIDPVVKKSMERYFTKDFGNPGSFNSYGLIAKKTVDDARERIAGILNADANEIVFTGSGTESINLAIKGVARVLREKGKHIITQKTEHHAVLETCRYLEKEEGFEATYLDVDKYGMIDLNELESSIRKDTVLISIMYANNEIGTIQLIKEIANIAKKHGVILHTDACQAAGFLDIDVKNIGVDLMTLNGSKIYAPKGIGLLYVKKGTPIKAIMHGGGQEFGLRPGTENVPSIVGFARALELVQKNKDKESKRLGKLRNMLIRGIMEKIPKTILNGHPTMRLPNNVNVSILNIEGEALLLHLNEEGICISTGSACTSNSLEPSHVILAIGLPYEAAHGSIRFTLGKKTNKKDIERVLEVMPGFVDSLRMISPVHLEVNEILNEAK
ncbi:IscS subfamily cysteine desulfurase [Candidatus Woesearchaeota archaeon]|nr:IscS subfamily cysteine desulfurase [Candidatus Woesearchaeota archaeon]